METTADGRQAHQLNKILDLAQSALRGSASVFYLIDSEFRTVDVGYAGYPESFSNRYHTGLSEFDPLLAGRLVAGEKKVAFLHHEQQGLAPAEGEIYSTFLNEYGFVDATEMVFWRDNAPFGGIGVLKSSQDPPATEETIAVANAMQSYLEFDLRSHPLIRETYLVNRLKTRFGLTKREIDVVKLVCDGATNQEISIVLDIGLSTVKTHVMRCFDKLGVGSRSAVMSLFLGGKKPFWD